MLFLLTIRPPSAVQLQSISQRTKKGEDIEFLERFGLVYERGAEVEEVLDEEGNLMNDFTGRVRFDENRKPQGD